MILSDSNEVIELIIQKGADVELSNNAGDTALHFAAQNGKITKTKNDSKKQLDKIWIKQSNQFHNVGNGKMVTLLIQKGAIVDHANNDRKTALHIAAVNGN